MTALWEGSPFERVARDIPLHPALRIAYCIGDVEYRIHLLFGCNPRSDDVPDAARECAAIIMDAMLNGGDLKRAADEVDAVLQRWKGEVN